MDKKSQRIRLIILTTTMWLIFFLFGLRLLNLQIVQGKDFLAMQNESSYKSQVIKAARGEIVDRNGSPFTRNQPSYDIVFDKALEPIGTTNETILRLVSLLSQTGEDWNDSLPLAKDGSDNFTDDEREITRLKGKNFLNLNSYATAKEANYWLNKRYDLGKYSKREARLIAGVRYEMEKQGYSISHRFTFANDIKRETAVLIKQENFTLPGVDVDMVAKRNYVDGSLAPHIIGRTGVVYAEELEFYLAKNRGYTPTDIVGKGGIERAFEDLLRGEDGVRKIELSPSYEVMGVSVEKPPVPGSTIALTIDKEMQKTAIVALENQIKKLNETAPEGKGKEADAGAVVAIDIKNSEILAAVTYPSYDLSVFKETFAKINADPRAPFLNRAFNGIYAPGSCFKPVTGTASLNEGITTPETKITCTGIYNYYAEYNYRPTCLSAHGPMTIKDALRASCNIYFYDAGRQLGIKKINKYAQMLGLGVKTGIELSETKGTLNDPDTKNPGDALQAAIGQLDNGFSPLQLANYTATLARNGERRDVTLIKGISKSYDLKDMKPYEKERTVIKSTIPEDIFETVREGMVAATHDPHGTAFRYLGDYPLKVASKTGTPETKEFPNSTFICYAPADDPQIAIAVVIEKGWHGYTGAPVARAVMDSFFFPEKQKEVSQEKTETLINSSEHQEDENSVLILEEN